MNRSIPNSQRHRARDRLRGRCRIDSWVNRPYAVFVVVREVTLKKQICCRNVVTKSPHLRVGLSMPPPAASLTIQDLLPLKPTMTCLHSQ